MSRKEFIDKLPPEQKKQLEELRKKNSEAMKANEVIKNLNADLKVVTQDMKDADAAHVDGSSAVGRVGRQGGYRSQGSGDQDREVHRDRNPDDQGHRGQAGCRGSVGASWAGAGRPEEVRRCGDLVQEGLELEAASKKPSPAIEGMANAGLGEIYARSGKVPEANAAYDAAAKAESDLGRNLPEERSRHLLPDGQCGCAGGGGRRGHQERSERCAALLPQGTGADSEGHRSTPRRRGSFCLTGARRPTRNTWNWRRPAPMPPSAGHSATGRAEGQLHLQGRQEVNSRFEHCSEGRFRLPGAPFVFAAIQAALRRLAPPAGIPSTIHSMSSALLSYERSRGAGGRITPRTRLHAGAHRARRTWRMRRAACWPGRSAADQDQPPFARSTRDGFACRAAEASAHVLLRDCRRHACGRSSGRAAAAGAAWEIMTGAPVPPAPMRW